MDGASRDGFAAVRSVGFRPVGQVFGSAVYYLVTVQGASCPGTSAGLPPGDGFRGPAEKIAHGLYEGRRTAIDRMTAQCPDLGAHGIVGATPRVTEIPASGLAAAAIEFTVIGTAVRADGCAPLTRPFTSDLSGPDFAKLIMAGWVPAGIALGIAVTGLHDELVTTSSGPWGTGNAELPLYTDLTIRAQRDARARLEQSVRGLGADGVVVSSLVSHVRSGACRAHAGGTDHFAEAVITGTAIARFAEHAVCLDSVVSLPLFTGPPRVVRETGGHLPHCSVVMTQLLPAGPSQGYPALVGCHPARRGRA